MTNSRKAIYDWKVWLGIFISVGCLWWALKDADWPKIFEASKRINWIWLLGCAPLFVMILILRAYRWTFFIDDDKSSLRLRYDVMNVGFLTTNILPLRLGEFVRAAIFARKTDRSILEVVATIATERVFDLIALGIIAVSVVPFLPVEGFLLVAQEALQSKLGLADGVLNFTKQGLLYLCGLGALGLFTGFFLFCKSGRPMSAWLFKRFNMEGGKIAAFTGSFFNGLETPIKNKSLLKVIFISLATWVAICIANYIVLFAFPIGDTTLGHVAGLSGAVFFELVICAAIAIPAAPGFVGVWQVAAKVSFIPFGAGQPGFDEGVLAFALVFHIFMYILTIIVGVESGLRQGVSVDMVRKMMEGKSKGTEPS